jgi:hypothetical protein
LGGFAYGREEGIRTLDTLPYTRFPGERLQPLGHLSIAEYNGLNLGVPKWPDSAGRKVISASSGRQ